MKLESKLLIITLNILFSLNIFSSSIESGKKELKVIENKIKTQINKITELDKERDEIENKIKKTASEIEAIKKNHKDILKQIDQVKRNLYSKNKELKKNHSELKEIKVNYNENLKALNRYVIEKEGNIPQLNDYSTIKLISSNISEIGDKEDVVSEINLEKMSIESKKKKLEELNRRIVKNQKQLNSKVKEQKKLIEKLDKTKISYKSIVKELEKRKKKIEKGLNSILKTRAKKEDKTVTYTSAKKDIGRLSQPLKGKIVTRFKQSKNGIVSNGIEIRGELGSKVFAASNGKIIYSGDFQGLGKVVMIEYGYNLIGVYGNLISTEVKVGETIKKGTGIGVLGYSSDGMPDLYYEVRFKLKSVDPESFF